MLLKRLVSVVIVCGSGKSRVKWIGYIATFLMGIFAMLQLISCFKIKENKIFVNTRIA